MLRQLYCNCQLGGNIVLHRHNTLGFQLHSPLGALSLWCKKAAQSLLWASACVRARRNLDWGPSDAFVKINAWASCNRFKTSRRSKPEKHKDMHLTEQKKSPQPDQCHQHSTGYRSKTLVKPCNALTQTTATDLLPTSEGTLTT